MELYFLRHGIAEDVSSTGKDEDRRLTEDGVSRMKKAAEGMRALDLELDAVVSSPLIRAKQTAEIAAAGLKFKEKIQFSEAITPHAEYGDFLKLLSGFPAEAKLLLVGHQPTFGEFVSRLVTGRSDAGIELKKGSLTLIELDDVSASPRGVLRWTVPSRILRELGRS